MIAVLYDVLEVEIAEPNRVRVLSRGKDLDNAAAIVEMAVIRRGCADHFFTTAAAGLYRDGDQFCEPVMPKRED